MESRSYFGTKDGKREQMEPVSNVPKLLYKYAGSSGPKILQTKSLKFTRPSQLNDPFEVRPFFEKVAEDGDWLREFEERLPFALQSKLDTLPPEMRRMISKEQLFQHLNLQRPAMLDMAKEVTRRLVPVMNEEFYKRTDSFIGILCLTEKPTDLLMWAHYGNRHRGMVLEFDASHPFFDRRRGPQDELYHLRQIVYSPKRPHINLMRTNGMDLFLTKSQDWDYEVEWRMMIPIQDCQELQPAFHVQAFPSECLRGVILGAHCDPKFRQQVEEARASDPTMSHVRLVSLKLDPQEYALRLPD